MGAALAEAPPAGEDGGFTLLGEAEAPSDNAAAFVGDVQEPADMGFAAAPEDDGMMGFAAAPEPVEDNAPIVLGPPSEEAPIVLGAPETVEDEEEEPVVQNTP